MGANARLVTTMNRDAPEISVIIPTWNRAEKLAKCLEALSDQSYPSYEIVVADNNSAEDIRAVCARFPRVCYCFESRVGSYAARNAGIRHSRGAVLAFTDSDCLPSRSWLENAMMRLQKTGADIVGGKIGYAAPIGRGLNIYEIFEEKMVRHNDQETFVRKNYAATANLITYRRVMDATGFFDENVRSLGDIEWCLRAHRKGFSIAYAEDAVVWHPRRSTHSEILKKVRRMVGGRQQSRKREGVTAWQFAWDLFKECPLSPKMISLVVSCPGIPLSRRPLFALAVWHYSIAAMVEKIRVMCGLSPHRGD
jgi:glycosyltransferase involved in cell wall biosynthesis